MAQLKSIKTVNKTALYLSYLNRRHGTALSSPTMTTSPLDAAKTTTTTENKTEYRYWEYRKRFNLLEALFSEQIDDIEGPDGGNRAIYDNELHASYEYVRWLCRKYQGLFLRLQGIVGDATLSLHLILQCVIFLFFSESCADYSTI